MLLNEELNLIFYRLIGLHGEDLMSKYDRFWQSIIDKIADLIKEAYVSSRSRKIDVSDLQMHGKRGNWYGSIIVSKKWHY